MEDETLRGLVDEARAAGAAYAEVRHATARHVEVEHQDGQVKKAVTGEEEGLSVRALVDGAWGFSATNRLDRDALAATVRDAVASARAIPASRRREVVLADAPVVTEKVDWSPAEDATGMALPDLARFLGEVEGAARVDERLRSVKLSLDALVSDARFANSDGTFLTTIVPRLLLQYELVARESGGPPVGYRARVGGTHGWEIFRDDDPFEKARVAADGALRLLHAEPCPSGRMTAIIDPNLAGVFAHECIGHACEADLVTAGESILEGRLGETIGNDLVSIVDDGTRRDGYGGLPFDDEGVRAARKPLVTDGVLTGYILSRETAGKLDLAPNGGARAESVGVPPIVRMSNTLIEAGDHTFEELLEGVDRGVYVKGTRGGQVDVAKGSFQFGAQEAWLIENGALTTPLRDASLQGSILETLRTIDGVGRDAKMAEPGICGKGQWVPVGDGGPHVRIQRAAIGGGA